MDRWFQRKAGKDRGRRYMSKRGACEERSGRALLEEGLNHGHGGGSFRRNPDSLTLCVCALCSWLSALCTLHSATEDTEKER